MSETQPSPTTYDSVPEGKRVELYNDDLPITGDRVPDDAITTDVIEQQIAHEAEETPAEKLERLEEELALRCNTWQAGTCTQKRQNHRTL